MITQDQRAAMQKMYKNDVSIAEICRKLKISRNTVIAALQNSQKIVKKVSKNSQKIVKKCQKVSKNIPKGAAVADKLKIDMCKKPDEEAIKQAIMIAFREALNELVIRLPDMSDRAVYEATVKLLQELNAKA